MNHAPAASPILLARSSRSRTNPWQPALVALALAVTASLRAGESALTVADLAAYRAALSGKGKGSSDGPPAAVGFRDLWDHPATYQRRRVQVQGKMVRRFRQPAFGTFPPLEEAWVATPADDLFCLVFPASATGTADAAPAKTPVPARPVRFVGTFLKLVEYQGGDGPRLAPLIVGPAPPVATQRGATPAPTTEPRRSWLDWMIGLAAAVVVALVLAHQHLRRPSRRPLDLEVATAPEPLFEDGAATLSRRVESESESELP